MLGPNSKSTRAAAHGGRMKALAPNAPKTFRAARAKALKAANVSNEASAVNAINAIGKINAISAVNAIGTPSAVMRGFMRASEYAAATFFGGVVYGALETLARGYTHPSMLITGGVCFSAMYRIDKSRRLNLLQKAFCGCAVITAAELTAGIICNIWLGLGVWDYSHLHPNLWGQICLPFSILWFALSFPAYGLCAVMRRALGVSIDTSTTSTTSTRERT